MPVPPVVVVGAGLAGACAALALARTGPVGVLEAVGPAAGASGAAAGLVNPFAGRRAARGWRASEALTALDRLADEAGVAVSRTGILRPARDATQAAAFRDAASGHPAEALFVAPEVSAERWPGVAAPQGALWIPGGGHVDVGALVRATLAAAVRHRADVRTAHVRQWRHEDGQLIAITDTDRIAAQALVLCPGADVEALVPGTWGRVKGQTATLGAALPPGFPAVAGGVYVVPTAAGAVVGATYEHTFTTLDADPAASLTLRDRAARLVPTLADAPVLGARAGVRLTVPASVSPERLPRLGRVAPGVWLFAGLGSRGLLTAPLLAEWLPAALSDPSCVPAGLGFGSG